MMQDYTPPVVQTKCPGDCLLTDTQTLSIGERVHLSIEMLENCLDSVNDHASGVHVDVVQSLEDCKPQLLSWWASHAPTPLQSPDWLLSWWEAYRRSSQQLAVVVVRQKDRIVGLVPLYQNRAAGIVRVLQWLGSGQACTDFQSIIADPKDQPLMQNLLADWLSDRRTSLGWHMLELDGLADPGQLQTLRQRLMDMGCAVQQVSHPSTWRVELRDGWAGFMAGLSKTQRAQARNLTNRFDKSGDYRLRIATGMEAASALQQIIELHQRRWQAVGVSGCFADERFRNFVQSGVQCLSLRNQAEVILLESAGRAVSGLLCLIDQAGNRFAYQSGRDPAFDAARVGQMLNFIAIRDACERGLGFIDYLRGDEVYKQRLGAQATPCIKLRVSAPTWTSRLPYYSLQLCQQLKQRAASLRRLASRYLLPAHPGSNPLPMPAD